MGRDRSMMGRGRSCHGGKMQEPPAGKSHEARDRTMDLSERRDGHAVGISNLLPPQRSPGADSDPVLFPWGLPSPTPIPGVHWVSWSLAISPVTLGGTQHGFILLTTKAASLQSARGARVVPLTFHLARLRQCWWPWVSSLSHPPPPSSP